MYTMVYDIEVGDYRIGMLDTVNIHKSVELLADTAVITLPASEYNRALDVEGRLRRGDAVVVRLGYAETGMQEEFRGYLQRIGTDNGNITLECEDDLFKFRISLENREFKDIALEELLEYIVKGVGGGYRVDSSYTWKYKKFVINNATGYDVLKKIQEECGADIYLEDDILHIHAPGEKVGSNVVYDFSQNVEACDLTYRKAEDRKVRVVVKALMPDGTVKEREYGTTGGDKVEIQSAGTDDASMRSRGESELKRLSFDGYDGTITTWMIPYCRPGDAAELHDGEYTYKDGRYYIRAVTTEFGKDGGKRILELGFRLT